MLSQQIPDLYTETAKVKSYAEENLDLYQSTPLCALYKNVLLDSATCLCIYGQNEITPVSETNYINTFDGYKKSWIRSVEGYAKNKQQILEARKNNFLNSDIVSKIIVRPIEKLPAEYTYINLLSTNGSYAYGHLLDITLRLFYLPKNIQNPCFLVSPYANITDFEYIIKTLSGYSNAIFLPVKATDKIVYSIPYMYELKQANGITNFGTTEQYDKFIFTFLDIVNPTEEQHKVFLARVKPIKRHIINFDEIQKELINKNVCIVNGRESFLERVKLLSNSSHICGYHGALFFDTCFCPETAKVLEYVPLKRPAKCFLRMYKRCKEYYIKTLDTLDDLNCQMNIEEIFKFYSL